MSEYIDADFAVVCDEWRPTVTSGEEQEYIKREDAIKANENYVPYQRLGEDRQSYMDRILKELPSADVVEVVRCKDCKWWDSDCGWCDLWGNTHEYKDGYCSYGERKDDDECK